jgi:hypothetical protein
MSPPPLLFCHPDLQATFVPPAAGHRRLLLEVTTFIIEIEAAIKVLHPELKFSIVGFSPTRKRPASLQVSGIRQKFDGSPSERGVVCTVISAKPNVSVLP